MHSTFAYSASFSAATLRAGRLLAVLFFGISCSRAEDRKSAPPRSSTSSRALDAASPPLAREPQASNQKTDTDEASSLPAIGAEQLLSAIRASSAKGTLVNVWASWCGPCRNELPMLNALARNLSNEGVRVMLVSADEPEDREKALAFLESAAIELPAYLARRPLGPFKVGLNPRWPGMVPATFLFDASAKLRYFWGGPVYEHEVLQKVADLLANRLVDGEADFTVAPGKVER